MLRKVPITLWVWFALSLVVEGTNVVVRLKLENSGPELPSLDDVYLAVRGTVLVRSLMVALAVFELARRVDGRARTAMRGAGWIMTCGFVLTVVEYTLGSLYDEKVRSVLDYAWKGEAIAFYAGLVAIFYAGRSWAGAPAAMVVVATTALMHNWVPYLSDAIQQAVYHAKMQSLYYGVLGFAWTFSFGWVLAAFARDTREPHVDGERADSGFALAAQALWIRVAAAAGVALFTLVAASSSTGGGGEGMVVFVFVLAPMIGVATAAAFVVGVARAAESRIEGLSPLLLVVGAAPVLWSLAPQLQLVGAALATVLDIDGPRMEPVLGTTSALALAAGFVLLCLALAGCRTGADPTLPTAGVNTTIAIVALQLLAVAVQHYARPATKGEAVMMLLFVAVANIVTIVALAKLLGRAGKAFGAGVSVPTARVVR